MGLKAPGTSSPIFSEALKAETSHRDLSPVGCVALAGLGVFRAIYPGLLSRCSLTSGYYISGVQPRTEREFDNRCH